MIFKEEAPEIKMRNWIRILKLNRFGWNGHVRYYSWHKLEPNEHSQYAHMANLADLDAMERNIILRQHKNNIPHIRRLLEELKKVNNNTDVKIQVVNELRKLPNSTHPRLLSYGDEPLELLKFCPSKWSNRTPFEFSNIAKRMNLYRMDHLGNFTGHKSYYLMNSLASLEQGLIQYALHALKKEKFQLISVPDILPTSVIQGCGMTTDGERTQVYKLDSGHCLSGTSEMALAGFFANRTFEEKDLPIKVCAVSRCFRAETSGLQEEKGIYRVHQFTKVEMFAVCVESQSELVLESFKEFELSLFKNLGVNFRLLDMPPSELGAPAYQKYDIEAWMPGRKMWGEISSCSNCTDYQAKRLNVRYRTSGKIKYAHTVNGTAAAIPRLLIALVETNQTETDVISIPDILKSFMRETEIRKDKRIPEIKLVKSVKAC